MTNLKLIIRWLIEHPEDALTIAASTVTPLLLDEEGNWIGDSDFPSGADYIDHVCDAIEVTGLHRYINQLQENGKTD
jgi:hypothetical protein